MDSGQPRTKDWSAEETTDIAGGDRNLTVAGQVEVGNTNATPRLSPSQSIPINERVLMLELSIEAQGIGNPVTTWKPAEYVRAVEEDEYESVEIIHQGDLVESVKVEKILS